MRIELKPAFGEIPSSADNLEKVGLLSGRFEEWTNVAIWPLSGVLRRQDGSIEIETIWVKKHLEQCGDYHSYRSCFPKRQRGCFFNLSLFWWGNYYHWFCDVLTRLYRVLPRLERDVRIILPPRLTVWQRRSLELIGLPFDRCVNHTGKRPWKVDRLVYASPVSMTGDHDPESLLGVRHAILQQLGCEAVRPGWRRLYLTRKATWSRSVTNEAELIPLLEKRGFEVVDCGTLSFEEQVRLFSEAQFAVGPHGAAFTNILWSPTGLKVFEIFERAAVRRCYWSMCQVLSHAHGCGVAESMPNGKNEPNIYVDPRHLATALDAMLETN